METTFNDEARIKYYKSIGDPWFADVEIYMFFYQMCVACGSD